jgi:hypothetical protein
MAYSLSQALSGKLYTPIPIAALLPCRGHYSVYPGRTHPAHLV